MIEPQSVYEARYDANPSEFEAWGKNKEQACRNRRAYDQWLECGFSGEPSFDLFGRFDRDHNLKAQETILLWPDGPIENTVECLQLPNGKWISGIHYMMSESGYCGGLSIWNHQYDSRIEALSKPMRDLIDKIKKDGKAKDREHIADVVKALDDIRQLSLF